MELDAVMAHARERLGLELQAVSLLRRPSRGRRWPEVWSLMTEQGTFWLVEEDGQVELFRATHAERASSPAAIRRFRELHPEAPTVPTRVPARMDFACRTCGRAVTRQRVSERIARQICPRCTRARREGERYHGDAEYRARRLASYATRYRQRRAGDGS